MGDFIFQNQELIELAESFRSAKIFGEQVGRLVRRELLGGVLGLQLPPGNVRAGTAAEPSRRAFGWRRGEMVDIVTADDAHVCARCRALAAGSPYPIEVAKKQLPHHPGCRCEIRSQYFLGRRSMKRPLTRAGSRKRKGYLKWAKSKGRRLTKVKRK